MKSSPASELVTWKMFVGNTSKGDGGDVQTWEFKGGTGTIGSIRNGAYTPLDFLFDGYTPKPYENTDNWFAQDPAPLGTDAYAGLQHFRIGANGLTIDTDGKTLGIDFSCWTITGPITKTGAGTLKLDGDFSSVPITVAAGTITFNGDGALRRPGRRCRVSPHRRSAAVL